MILFVTGTGTGVGKTVVSRALAAALKRRSFPVLAVKPLETGCDPDPQDAIALAAACAEPELALEPGFYRARRPLSPYAATLAGEPPPEYAAIVETCKRIARAAQPLIVEAAGGLLVPLDATRTMADLAISLGSKLLLVAPDRLGVLSDVLAVVEAAHHRALPVAAIVLNRGVSAADASQAHNAQILRERCAAPVISFAPSDLTDETLVAEAQRSGLIAALGLARG